jgi:predicted ferric reductase
VLFWAGLAAVVAPWWLRTVPGSLSGTGADLTAAGRITGLVGGYALLVQVLMMSRVRWLERWTGARHLSLWHRELGGFVVVAVLAHAVLITLGYAATDRITVLGEAAALLTGYEGMLAALVATMLVAGTGLLGIRALRRALPYEVWYRLHLSAYLILLLGYGHQFATGQELARGRPGRYLWIGLYALVAATLLWGRLLAPAVLNLRHRLRVARVVDEGGGMVSVYLTGRHLSRLDAKAGQFFRWRFLAPGCWAQAHPFSLSAAPNERWLRVTAKVVGDHTARLRDLRPGVRAYVEGPAGDFTADRRTRTRALLIAAGSGIAPLRALLEELPAGTVVIYRAHTGADVVFRQELQWLAQARGATLWYLVGSRDDRRNQYFLTGRGLLELVPDVTARDVYVCGPERFATTATRALRRSRVPRRQIHLDAFEF